MISRRSFCAASAASTLALSAGRMIAAEPKGWRPKYMLASCMYGYESLAAILPEVAKTGAEAIDLWPKVHGNQREQLTEMGEERFAELLKQHHTKLGCLTQYHLGPFGLQKEMRLAKRLQCQTIVTGGRGPKNLKGAELKKAVGRFVEQMKPHLAVAEETGVTIAIENHANNLIDSADSIRWLAEMSPNASLGIALAPYHLPQDEAMLASLIGDLGEKITVFYAWQHGAGCMQKQPKEKELLQMPGRGELDFAPLMAALRKSNYAGWVEIFMHPFPRGILILDTVEDVTAEINRSRDYLTRQLKS